MTRAHARIETPLGPMQAQASPAGLHRLGFDPSPPGGAAAPQPVASPLLERLREQLSAYFAGAVVHFDLPLAPEGTAFEQQVWAALQTIPTGETRSYGELARALGQPTAARAVGLANARNPIAILIPCHRVIGADGRLTGYAGGLDRKEALLRLEGALPATLL